MRYKYIVCCTLTNNTFLSFFDYTFSEAVKFAEAISNGDYAKRIEMHNIVTGATTTFVF